MPCGSGTFPLKLSVKSEPPYFYYRTYPDHIYYLFEFCLRIVNCEARHKILYFLRQHCTKGSAELRRQIFRQTKQKPQRILYVCAMIFVMYDGKDASKSVLQALADLCAGLA